MTLLRWPEEGAARHRLAAERRPRLLLLAPGVTPPDDLDELEDWLRLPMEADELAARCDTLAARAAHVRPRAVGLRLDDGVLTGADGRGVALPGLESRLFALLLARSEAVVGRPAPLAAGWPDGPPADPRAVDGVLRRLRRRVAHLGVTIHAVPGGYLLDHAASVSVTASVSVSATATA